MKHLRLVLVFLCITALALSCVACEKEPSGNESAPESLSAEKESIPAEKYGRKLVWHDEFDGDTLDMDKWCFDATMGASDREYINDEAHARVENGDLHLLVTRSDKEGCNFALPLGVDTRTTMNYQYGYVEMKARVPFRHGAWPSFWMKFNTPFSTAGYMAEVDIFEVFSHSSQLSCNLHKWGKTHVMLGDRALMVGSRDYTFENSFHLNEEYHIYGMEWDEHDMTFYVDGVAYCSIPIDERGEFSPEELPGMEGFHEPAYVIVNNEIYSEGSDWKPENRVLNEYDEMPIDYYIAYMRLYQKEGEKLYLKDEIAKASQQ